MEEITKLLLDSQSTYPSVPTKLEHTLARLQEENLHQFSHLFMCLELGKDQQTAESRQLAGILLKNYMDAVVKKRVLVEQWRGYEAEVALKSQMKQILLENLGLSLVEASHTSAQVIAMVASIEIPQKQWPELIVSLLSNMTQQGSLPQLKQSTLAILGYICAEISLRHLTQKEVDSVLTAVLEGMNQSQPADVRVSATLVLNNALDFFRRKFENEVDRTLITNVVCETACSENAKIRRAAFGCLVTIATKYYKLSGEHFERLLKVLTSEAVNEDEEKVALQTISFWSSMCEFEIHCKHGSPDSGDSSLPQACFIKRVLPHLVPMLLKKLKKHEEGMDKLEKHEEGMDKLEKHEEGMDKLEKHEEGMDNLEKHEEGMDKLEKQEEGMDNLEKQKEGMDHDDDAFKVSMAARDCLCRVSRTVGDEIVGLVIPFVHDNIVETKSWPEREAAISAFGSILDGSTINKLSPDVLGLLRVLIPAMNDENQHVRDTNAWTLDRIFRLSDSPESGSSSAAILKILQDSINSEPNLPETAQRAFSVSLMVIKHLTEQSQSQMVRLQQHQRAQSQPADQQPLRAEQSRPQQSKVREKLTGSERKSLIELMPLVRAHLLSKPELGNTMWGISLLDEEKSQIVFLKFLRATDFHVDNSLKMLKVALEWRRDVKINEICEGQPVVGHSTSIFIYGHDREGHAVVYDNVYSGFPKNIFTGSDRRELERTVSDFLRSRDRFMEMTLRELGGDSSFLYIFNLDNKHGLPKKDLSLVTELTREKLKLSQKSYPNFATTQLFINCSWMECVKHKMSGIHRAPRSNREVVLAQTSKTLETLIKYVRPNQIPHLFGGLSENAEDISSEDISSVISVKAGKRKTIEIECPNRCEILLTFRSTGLVYDSAFIPGTFRTVGGHTSFTEANDNHEFSNIEAVETEAGLRRHCFKVPEPGKLVVRGNNPTSSKAKLLYSYRVNYNVN